MKEQEIKIIIIVGGSTTVTYITDTTGTFTKLDVIAEVTSIVGERPLREERAS